MKIKTESFAWGTSIGFHVVLLLLLATTGVFSMANHEPPDLTEVALYDVSGGDEESGASSSAEESAAEPEVNAAAEVALPDTAAPALEPKETPEQQHTDQPKQEKQKPEAKNAGNAEHHDDHHKGNGHGEGKHDGNGNAKKDSGEGKGGGNGGKANANSTVPEVPPQLTYRAMPAYPENLRQQNITGTVGISFVVGADGSVTSATVDSSSGYPEMDAAALQAVYQYTFSPALNSAGQPVACGNHTNIHFALR